MEKKIKIELVIEIIIIAVVFISGCINQEPNKENLNNPVSVCEQIKDKNNLGYKYECLGIAKHDINICKQAEEPYRSICIAVINNDVSICENMEKNNISQFKDDCFTDIALVGKNASICEKVVHSSVNRQWCYYIQGILTKDTSRCEKITERNMERTKHICLAYVLNNLSECENIKYPKPKNACTAIVNGDVSMCDKGDDSCYNEIALFTRDASLCRKTGHDTAKDICYMNVALSMMTISAE